MASCPKVHMCVSLRPHFTSKLVPWLAFGTPKFYIVPYDKINSRPVNLSCNCDVKLGLRLSWDFGLKSSNTRWDISVLLICVASKAWKSKGEDFMKIQYFYEGIWTVVKITNHLLFFKQLKAHQGYCKHCTLRSAYTLCVFPAVFCKTPPPTSKAERTSPGPYCSKPAMSLVYVSLKFQTFISEICQYFLLKKREELLHCKRFSHFVSKKISV